MKYTVTVLVTGEINEVIEKYVSREFAFKWMDNLKSYEQESLNKNTLVFNQNGKEMVMNETIEILDLPKIYKNTYQLKDTFNYNTTTMKQVNDQVEISLTTEFKFKGFTKYIAPIMKNVFKKQTRSNLNRFKTAFEAI